MGSGSTIQVSNEMETCKDCRGTGTIQLFTSSKPCAKCGGTGKAEGWKTLYSQSYGPMSAPPPIAAFGNSLKPMMNPDGTPAMLLGYPIFEAGALTSVGTSSPTITFGRPDVATFTIDEIRPHIRRPALGDRHQQATGPRPRQYLLDR
jgi:hypothetical protein